MTGKEKDMQEKKEKKPVLFVVGDSTVCEFPKETIAYPRYGYGTRLKDYLDTSKIDIKNLALSGRSSKSFLKEENYAYLLSHLSEGDFLLIGFGHNDEKAEEERFTDANGDYKTEGSFAYNLYTNYIRPALDKKAHVVVCTPICRYDPDGDYSAQSGHVTSDAFASGKLYKGGDYPASIRKLCSELSLPLIDLTEETKELYLHLDPKIARRLFAFTSEDVQYDKTHTSFFGASYNAYFVAKDLLKTSSPLKEYVRKEKLVPPTLECLKLNPAYRPLSKNSEVRVSDLFPLKEPVYGTEYGNLGELSVSKGDLGDIKELAEDAYIVRMGNPWKNLYKGGIDEEQDGFFGVFAFKDIDNDYLFRSKATLLSCGADKTRVSFGLMIRKEIKTDVPLSTHTDYVSAGFVSLHGKTYANFSRRNGKLVPGEEVPVFHEGDVFMFSIEKSRTVYGHVADYTCVVKTGDYEKRTVFSALDLKNGEDTKIYFVLFASTSAEVKFEHAEILTLN